MRKSNANHLFYNAPNTREFFGHIQRFLEVGFWYWDSKSNHIHFSKKILAAMGIKSDDEGIALDDFFSAVHPEDKKVLQKAFTRLLSDKATSGDLEFRILRKGYWRWARTKATVAEHDEQGNVSIIIGKFFDIDTTKYTPQPAVTEKKNIYFSFFSFRPSDNTFQWLNPRQAIFNLKSTGKSFSLFEELRGFVSVGELNQITQRWRQFVKSTELSFSMGFNYNGPEKLSRRLKIIASKYLSDVDIIEGAIVDISSVVSWDDGDGRKLKYPSLLNMHQLFVFGFDSTNNLSFCNKYSEKILGYKQSELFEEQLLRKLFIPSPDTYKRFIDFVKSGGTRPFECIIICKDGTERVVSWSLVQDVDNIHDTFVVGRDITFLRQVEEKNDKLESRISNVSYLTEKLLLHANEENLFVVLGEELERIFSKKVSLIFSYDSSDNFITIEGMFGVSHRVWESFINELGWNPVGRRFMLKPEIIELISTRQPIKVSKSIYEISDGLISVSAAKIIEKNFNVDEIYYCSFYANSRFYGGIVVFDSLPSTDFELSVMGDIANTTTLALNKILSEKEYSKQIENLKQLNNRKLHLLSHVSHEIRTPLNAILGFSQLLSNSELNDTTKNQYINIINSKGKLLTRLINDIIDFNKIEKGELTIVRSAVNINKLLLDIYSFYSNELELFKRENIELRISIPQGTDFLELFTDEGRLVQVIENIIDNALKFTERGTVEFGYTIEQDKICIFVRDTGVGIDPKMQELIFEKYRQIEAGQSNNINGLGLRISKEIVSLLNGTISIISQLGTGTTVNVELPLMGKDSYSSNLDEESLLMERRVDFKNKVILIVDDEEVNYLILNELLTVWGATTLWAKNGKEAVDLVNSINQNIDAVLMDIRMPVMDGYAATMEIKQINPKIPIIAQTAYASEEDRLKAEAAGCNGYITKPIETSVLSEVLEIFLNA